MQKGRISLLPDPAFNLFLIAWFPRFVKPQIKEAYNSPSRNLMRYISDCLRKYAVFLTSIISSFY